MSCGRTYVGQSGRCVNVRLREHHSSLKCRPSSHLSLHCAECKCTPRFDDTTIIFQNGDQTVREVAEAFFIARLKDSCISRPSLSLLDKEIDLLVLGLWLGKWEKILFIVFWCWTESLRMTIWLFVCLHVCIYVCFRKKINVSWS